MDAKRASAIANNPDDSQNKKNKTKPMRRIDAQSMARGDGSSVQQHCQISVATIAMHTQKR